MNNQKTVIALLRFYKTLSTLISCAMSSLIIRLLVNQRTICPDGRGSMWRNPGNGFLSRGQQLDPADAARLL